uniref:DUF2726 domain-containing protein n=1 Tax=viral metagenome TaxID=1070528 RepID=A0A6C0E0X3_9ZZZZ
MIELFYKIKEFWNEYDFEIVICCLLVFFLILALYRKLTGQTGSWSNGYFYNRSIFKNNDKPQHFKRDSKGEVECRRVLEAIFRKPFNKARPDFLNNPVTGGNYNLELDCYNEDLRIAVEYSGKQHYEYVPFFHKNKEAFYNQKYRDDMKRRICKDNGITLIEVPHTVKIENIEQFLKDELKQKLRNNR